MVGVFTIAVGFGPRTVPDVVYHLAILTTLVWGLVVAARAPRPCDEAARVTLVTGRVEQVCCRGTASPDELRKAVPEAR